MKLECTILATAIAAGCASLPSVGPNYETPDVAPVEHSLPDAGQPTTNLTATAEYRPADSNEDARAALDVETVAKWWTRFNDPVLVSLVEGGISNNISFQIAQARLEQSAWELLGSYAGFMPQLGVGAKWNRYWYRENNAGRTHYNVRNFALDGNWEIDIFGGNRRLAESALAQAESAGWTVADAWVALTGQPPDCPAIWHRGEMTTLLMNGYLTGVVYE